VTRLNFDEKDYDIVKNYIEHSGGCKEDFITDEIVELGDDEVYINKVLEYMNSMGIRYWLMNKQ